MSVSGQIRIWFGLKERKKRTSAQRGLYMFETNTACGEFGGNRIRIGLGVLIMECNLRIEIYAYINAIAHWSVMVASKKK